VSVKQATGHPWQRTLLLNVLIPALAVLLSLAIGALLIMVVRVNPLDAYGALFQGAFGRVGALTQLALRATPLLLIGLGLTLAFRSRVWNIGAEGQFYMGACVATWLGLTLTGWPTWLILPAMVVAAALAGAVWGAIPGLLKAKRGTNEIVTSLLMNYVAIFFISYLVRLPMKDPEYYLPHSATLDQAATLSMIPGTKLHIGLFIALVCVPLVYVLLWKTPLGYRLRIVGSNPDAARYAGINVPAHIVLAMALSGAFAGVAAMIEVVGVHHRLMVGISPGFGYSGIVVALMGRLNPIGVLVAAFFFASLVIGAGSMQRVVGLPVSLTEVIQGLVVLFVVASDYLVRRWR
jgi:general nucleoside transport system permease protein